MPRRIRCALILLLLALGACVPGPTGTPTPVMVLPSEPPVQPTFTLPPTPLPQQATAQPVRTGEAEGGGTPAAPAGTPRPIPTAGETGIQVFHNSGQTFITWGELPSGSYGERYRVYAASLPITRETLPQADLLADVPPGSAEFLAGRMTDPASGNWGQRFFLRLSARSGGGEVPPGQGLLVWTVSRADLGDNGSGVRYYAVTIRLPDGSEHLPQGYASPAVAESVADPLPVEIGPLLGGGTHVLLQYMDLHTWNATFHAPNPLNGYYGLDPADPRVPGALQYAYDYAIYDPVCAERRDPAPVVLLLQDGPPVPRPELSNVCAYVIIPMDTGRTGWFGFSQVHDFQGRLGIQRGSPVANFTEQRILRMLYDQLRAPAGPVAADPQRVYVVGAGSGAAGALALASRYPKVFAAAYLTEPVSDFNALENPELRHYLRLWGERGLNLPVLLRAPGGWALPLQGYAGTPVWRWQNLNRGLSQITLPAAPLGVAAVLDSQRAAWGSQVAPAFTALNNGHQAWGGWIAAAGESIPAWAGLVPNLQTDTRGLPFYGFRVPRDETVPGMSGGEASGPIPPSRAAVYNQTVLWSSSWLSWDGTPIDTATRWEMSLCAVSLDEPRSCGSGQAQRINITPRRAQRFPLLPGREYAWESRSIADGSLLDRGRVTATNAGLVTVRNLLILPQGIRLSLSLVSGQSER